MKRSGTSIRTRLTLWYTVILLVILAVLSLLIYLYVHNRLTSGMRSQLDSGYAVVEDVIMNSEGDIFDVYHLGNRNPFQLTKGGEVAYHTGAWLELGLTEPLDGRAFDSYGSLRTAGGKTYMIRLDSIPEYAYELAYAHDATELEESIRSLVVILLASFPFGLVLAVAGGYILAGRALSPVAAVTSKAREITADRLSERLPVVNPNDEIGRLAAVFNETLARLESSFERLRRFTADASHELRTPLTSIRSTGEVALQGTMEVDAYRETIGSMLEETERLTHLVDNLLTLARGDSGKARLDPSPVDCAGLVREVADELCILAEEKGQELTLTGETELTIRADYASIRQALSNVLHNAITYTPSGGHIGVRLKRNRN